MKKKLQVFVSSTYTDLIEERQAAVEAILNAGHIPAGMELFKSGNDSQLQTIYKWIDESDVYMLILGGRYGTIKPKSGKSYTQLEYEYALSKNIPVFAVVLSQSYLTNKINTLGQNNVIEQNSPNKYRVFKEFVMSKIIKEVDDCKDIKLVINSSLNELDSQYNLKGWIPNNKIKFISSEIMDSYIIERIKNAQESIYHLSWKDNYSRPNHTAYQNYSSQLIKTAESKLQQDVFYKDIFTFPYMRRERIDKINTLKKYKEKYWCGYFESNEKVNRFPKLHFLIIDNKEVIFASYDYIDHYCSISDKDIINIMLSYFEESWLLCKKIIDINGFHQKEFDAAILDCQSLSSFL